MDSLHLPAASQGGPASWAAFVGGLHRLLTVWTQQFKFRAAVRANEIRFVDRLQAGRAEELAAGRAEIVPGGNRRPAGGTARLFIRRAAGRQLVHGR